MVIVNVNVLWPHSGLRKSIPLLVALTMLALTASALISSALISSALGAEPLELFNGKNLTGWKAPTGTWSAVQSIALDPANNKAFVATPGPECSSTAAPTRR